MKLSKQPFQEDFKKPERLEEIPTSKVIEKMGLVKFLNAGFPFYTTLGVNILTKVKSKILELAKENDFSHVQMPFIHSVNILRDTKKYEKFNQEFFQIDGMMLRATSEEYMDNIIENGLVSYNQLPLRFVDITEAFRDICRPEGFLKTKQFGGAVFTSYDDNKKGQQDSQESFINVASQLFDSFKIPSQIIKKNGGVEFIYLSEEGELFQSFDRTIKGISLGMGYPFNEIIPPKFQSRENIQETSIRGTYGIGLQRVIYAALDANRDIKGFNLPASIRPYEAGIILLNPKNEGFKKVAEGIYSSLGRESSTYLDDRVNTTLKEKLDYADFIGVTHKYILGTKEYKEGKILPIDRDGKKQDSNLEVKL